MTFGSTSFESYLPAYDTIPEKWEEARGVIVEHLKIISNEINIREIGWFLDQELLSGKAFIPTQQQIDQGSTSQSYRTVLRKVIDFGTLPNFGTKTVPHEIIFDGNFSLIQMFLSATDPVNLLAFGLMYWSNDPGSIILNMDSNDVIVTTASDYSDYTRSYVVIEYIQEL